MRGRGHALGLIGVLVGHCGALGCSDRDAPQSASGPPAIAPAGGGWGSAADLAKLPGEIWYVASERSGSSQRSKAMRIAAGKREAIADNIVPYARLPDGRVVGVRRESNTSQLVFVTVDGGVRIVPFGRTANEVRDVVVASGAILATFVDDGESSIQRIDVATGNAVKLADGSEPTALAGDRVAFVAGGDVQVTSSSAGGVPRALVATPATESAPRANREGTALLFESDRDGSRRLFLWRDGTEQRATDRSEGQRDEHSPAWSPDGRLIAYVVQRGTRRHVWIRDLEARSEIDVTAEGIHDGQPAFSPDGRWIVVSRTRGHDVDLWAIPAGVGEPVRLTIERYDDVAPRWFESE